MLLYKEFVLFISYNSIQTTRPNRSCNATFVLVLIPMITLLHPAVYAMPLRVIMFKPLKHVGIISKSDGIK